MKSNLAIVCQKYLGYLAPLFAVVGVLALSVGAQVNTASLTGQVTDANGGAAKGATVSAKNISSPGAVGKITTLAGDPCVMQFALKLVF